MADYIEQVATSSAQAVSNTVSVPRPSGVQDGDLLLLIAHAQNTSGLITPSGFTSIFSTMNASGHAMKAYTRRITSVATEAASYTFSMNISSALTVTIIAYRNVASTPVDITVTPTNAGVTTTPTAPSITTVTNNALVVWVGAVLTSADDVGEPSGTTVRYKASSGLRLTVADTYQNTAGATGAKAGSVASAAHGITALIPLRPANPGADPGSGGGPTTHTRTVPATAYIYDANAPTETVLNPSADAQTSSAAPDTNFGTLTPMEIRQSGPDARIFMRFELPNSLSISSATLRLYIDNGTSGAPTMHAVTSPWTESGITHNTMPTYGPSLTTLPMTTAGVWAEYDVTSFVPLTGTFDIAIVGTSTNGADVVSREGVNKPELVLMHVVGAPSIERTVPASAAVYASPRLQGFLSVAEARHREGPITPVLGGGASVVGDAWRLPAGGTLSARVTPLPPEDAFDDARTLYVVGDVHVGNSLAQRRTWVTEDVQEHVQGRWSRIIQTGDLTHNALSGEVAEGKAFMDSLGSGWKIIGGNHDYYSGVNQATFEATYGTTRNWYEDIGTDIRIIGLSNTGGSATTVVLDTTALDYLGDRLGETSRDCIIFCHAPLYNSVLIDPTWPDSNGSEESNRHATPHATIMTILSESPNARAWLSGHTHSALTSPQLIMPYPVTGGGSVLALNVSSIAYPGKGSDTLDRPLATCFLTVYEDRIEVRFRNHRLHNWHAIGGQTIYTYMFDRWLP